MPSNEESLTLLQALRGNGGGRSIGGGGAEESEGLRGFKEWLSTQPDRPVREPQYSIQDVNPDALTVEDFGGNEAAKRAFDRMVVHHGGRKSTGILQQEEAARAKLEELREKYPYPEQRVQMGIATKEEAQQQAIDWHKTRQDREAMVGALGEGFGGTLYNAGQGAARRILAGLPFVSEYDMPSMDPGIRQSEAYKWGGAAGDILAMYGGVRTVGAVTQSGRLGRALKETGTIPGAIGGYIAAEGAPLAIYGGLQSGFDPSAPERPLSETLRHAATFGGLGLALPGLQSVARGFRGALGRASGRISTETARNDLIAMSREVAKRQPSRMAEAGWQASYNAIEGMLAEYAMHMPDMIEGRITIDDFVDEMKRGGVLDAMLGLLSGGRASVFGSDLTPRTRKDQIEVDADLIKAKLKASGLTETLTAIGAVETQAGTNRMLSPAELGPLAEALKSKGLDDVAKGLEEIQAGNVPGGRGEIYTPPGLPGPVEAGRRIGPAGYIADRPYGRRIPQQPEPLPPDRGLPTPPDVPRQPGLTGRESTLLADVTRQTDPIARQAEAELAGGPLRGIGQERPDLSELSPRLQSLLEQTLTPVEPIRRGAEEELAMGEGRRIAQGERVRRAKEVAAMPTVEAPRRQLADEPGFREATMERDIGIMQDIARRAGIPESELLTPKAKTALGEMFEQRRKQAERVEAMKGTARMPTRQEGPERPVQEAVERTKDVAGRLGIGRIKSREYRKPESLLEPWREGEGPEAPVSRETTSDMPPLPRRGIEMEARAEARPPEGPKAKAAKAKPLQAEREKREKREKVELEPPVDPASLAPKGPVTKKSLATIVERAKKVAGGRGRTVEEIAKGGKPDVRYSVYDLSPKAMEVLERTKKALESDDPDSLAIAKDIRRLQKDEAFEVAKRAFGWRAVERDALGQIIRTKRQLLDKVAQVARDRRVDKDAMTGLGSQNAWIVVSPKYDKDPNKLVLMADVAGLGGANDYGSYVIGDDAMKKGGAHFREFATKHGISPRDLFRSGGDEFATGADAAKVEAMYKDLEDFTDPERFFQAFESKKGWIENRLIVATGKTSEEAGVNLSRRKEEYKQWAKSKGIFISKQVADPFKVLQEHRKAFMRLPRDMRAEMTVRAGELARAMEAGGEALKKAKASWDALISEAKRRLGIKDKVDIKVVTDPSKVPTYTGAKEQPAGKPKGPKKPPRAGERGHMIDPFAGIGREIAGKGKKIADVTRAFVNGLTKGTIRLSLPESLRFNIAERLKDGTWLREAVDPRIGMEEMLNPETADIWFHLMTNRGGGITFDKDGVMELKSESPEGDIGITRRFVDPNEIIGPEIPWGLRDAQNRIILDQVAMQERLYDKGGVFDLLRRDNAKEKYVREKDGERKYKFDPLQRDWKKYVDMDAYKEADERLWHALNTGNTQNLKNDTEREVYRLAREVYNDFRKLFAEVHGRHTEGWGLNDYVTWIRKHRTSRGSVAQDAEKFRRPGFGSVKHRTGELDEEVATSLEYAMNHYIPGAIAYLHLDAYTNFANEKAFGVWSRVKGVGHLKGLLRNKTITIGEPGLRPGNTIHVTIRGKGEAREFNPKTGKNEYAYQEATVTKWSEKNGIEISVTDEKGRNRKFSWDEIESGKVTIFARQGKEMINPKTGKTELYGLIPLYKMKGWKNKLRYIERFIEDVSNSRARNKILDAVDLVVNHAYKAYLGGYNPKPAIANMLQHIITASHIGVKPHADAIKAYAGEFKSTDYYTKAEIEEAFNEIVGRDPTMHGVMREGQEEDVFRMDPSGSVHVGQFETGKPNIKQVPARIGKHALNVMTGRYSLNLATKKGWENLYHDHNMMFFKFTEHSNRGVAALGSYMKARRYGMGHREAVGLGKEVVRKTQGIYGKEMSPSLMRQGAESVLRNAAKKAGGQFQRYPTLWTRYVTGITAEMYWAGRVPKTIPAGVDNPVPVPGTKAFNEATKEEQKRYKEVLKGMPEDLRQAYETWARDEDYAKLMKRFSDPARFLRFALLTVIADQVAGKLMGQDWGEGILAAIPFSLVHISSAIVQGEDPTRYLPFVGTPSMQLLLSLAKFGVSWWEEDIRQAEQEKAVGRTLKEPLDKKKWDDLRKIVAKNIFGTGAATSFEWAFLTKMMEEGEIGYQEENPLAVFGIERLWDRYATPRRYTREDEYLRRLFLPGRTAAQTEGEAAVRAQKRHVQDLYLANRYKEKLFWQYHKATVDGDIEAAREAVRELNAIPKIYGTELKPSDVKRSIERMTMQPIMTRVMRGGNVMTKAKNLVEALKALSKQPEMLSERQVRQMLAAVFGARNSHEVPEWLRQEIGEWYTKYREASGNVAK